MSHEPEIRVRTYTVLFASEIFRVERGPTRTMARALRVAGMLVESILETRARCLAYAPCTFADWRTKPDFVILMMDVSDEIGEVVGHRIANVRNWLENVQTILHQMRGFGGQIAAVDSRDADDRPRIYSDKHAAFPGVTTEYSGVDPLRIQICNWWGMYDDARMRELAAAEVATTLEHEAVVPTASHS